MKFRSTLSVAECLSLLKTNSEDKQGKCQIITKGAVEEMIEICSYAEFDKTVQPFTPELKQKARKISEQMNRQGMRVLAVAQKSYLDKECHFCVKDENDMVLIGFLAFLEDELMAFKDVEFRGLKLTENELIHLFYLLHF